MQFTFLDNSQEKCKLLKRSFQPKECYSTKVHCGDFYDYAKNLKEQGKIFIVVSPANSFGMMDGGYDEAIRQFYLNECNTDIISFVQTSIGIEYGGEQPIGTCLSVGSFGKSVPMLYHIPTMRFPMDVSHTNNAYMAMKSLILQVIKDEEEYQIYGNVDEIIVPIFCGGYGHMPTYQALWQMNLAWGRFIGDGTFYSPKVDTWEDISKETYLQTVTGIVQQQYERQMKNDVCL